jgi:Rieske Fe-S protein
MGCPVKVAGTELNCPCHGSKYNALTGAVLHGPAPKSLPSVAVAVQGGNVVAG